MTDSYTNVGTVFMDQLIEAEFKTLAPPGTLFTMDYWKDSIKRVETAQKIVKNEIETNKKTLSKADYTFYKKIHDDWFEFSLSQGYGSKERLESFSAIIDKFKKRSAKKEKSSTVKLTEEEEVKLTEETKLTEERKIKEDKEEAKRKKEEAKVAKEQAKKLKEEEKARKVAQLKANIARMANGATDL